MAQIQESAVDNAEPAEKAGCGGLLGSRRSGGCGTGPGRRRVRHAAARGDVRPAPWGQERSRPQRF